MVVASMKAAQAGAWLSRLYNKGLCISFLDNAHWGGLDDDSK